jgi:uncharacterized FlaG/YvyC family protein
MNISSIPQLPAPASALTDSGLAQASSEQHVSTQALIQAVKAVNSVALFGPENEVTFVKDRDTNRLVTRVVNRDSRELVTQIPSEQILRMAAAATEG